MKEFDTLYARNSSGQINEWNIKIISYKEIAENGSINGSAIIIGEGLLQGKKSETTKVITKGKNIGKMNATNHYDQAVSEALSRWEKKKKQGYKSLEDLKIDKSKIGLLYIENTLLTLEKVIEDTLPKNRTDANNISKPMKAQPYFNDKGEVRIKFPCFGQPKLNGFRVMTRWEKVIEGEGIFAQEVEKVVFRSKEGLRYTTLEHIENDINKGMFSLSDGTDLGALDGEMYIEGEILSEISSAVRKKNNKTPLIKFYIFDYAVENIKQNQRINYINLLKDYIYDNKLRNIVVVDTYVISNNKEAQNQTDKWIKLGYEGGIFRDTKSEYQFGKRPQTMTKLKRSLDKEFIIKDVKGGDNTPDLGIFVCLQEDGLEFSCTPEGTVETKKEYLFNKHKYIGKKLTVRFFERTKDNKPFHAVGVAIRDYE